MSQKYSYKIEYTVFYKDKSQKSGEVPFESESSEAELIPFDEILPRLALLEQQFKEQPGFEGLKSEIVPV